MSKLIKTHDLSIKVGEYINKEWVKKNQYLFVGSAFENQENGNISIKLWSIPVWTDWNWRINLFPIKEKLNNNIDTMEDEHF